MLELARPPTAGGIGEFKRPKEVRRLEEHMIRMVP